MLKKASLLLLIILYVSGGINHFIHPEAYLPIIPDYLPYPMVINIVSGILEIILGSMLIFSKTRAFAAYGIIILLVLFIPTHIYMIQKGGCMSEAICIPNWAAWIRLFPLQFLLMAWAWGHRK
jgi:uncharacterized membrane protein